MYNSTQSNPFQSNTLQYKCLSLKTVETFEEAKSYLPEVDFSPLKALAKDIIGIQPSYDRLNEMSNSTTAYQHYSLSGSEALFIGVVASVATAILFGCLSSSVAVGLSLGVISFIATISLMGFANNYMLERKCNRVKQEIEMKDKSIQGSMYVAEQFCNTQGKKIIGSRDEVIKKIKATVGNGRYYNPNAEANANALIEKFKIAHQELEILCAHYAKNI